MLRHNNRKAATVWKRSYFLYLCLFLTGLGYITFSLLSCSGSTKCFVDLDCPTGKYCKSNKCFSDCLSDDVCPADHTCNKERGLCVIGNCKPKAKKSCIGGHVFWLNSCGTPEEKIQDCGNNGCQGTACNGANNAVCGNNNCDFNENCVSCPQDCGCSPGVCDVKTATCRDQNSCGNNTCDSNKGENCATCPQDCTCQSGQICDPVGRKCISQEACGNGNCETAKGENCTTCLKDCPCPTNRTCQNGACLEPSLCGNNTCDTAKGETCSTCPQDCTCQSGQTCINGQCKSTTGCNNNGLCQSNRQENCSNCPGDCGCSPTQKCINNRCQTEQLCGNGVCDTAKGENCGSCSKDCTCGPKEQCNRNRCQTINLCGNGVCEGSEGENCSTCSKDCTCKAGQQCNNGSCQVSCGNGVCEGGKGENCSSCPKDCACSSGKVCRSGKCDTTCPTGSGNLWACNATKTKRWRCGISTGYKLVEENCPNGCKPGTVYDVCCTCKAGSKRCVGSDLEQCKSSCDGWSKIKTCSSSNGQFCSSTSKDCKCTVAYYCPKLYGYRCLGTERQWCYKNPSTQCQFWIKSSLQCSGATPICNQGNCCACTPGAQRCNLDKVEQCSSDCQKWELKQKCSAGRYCCNLKCNCTD